MQEKMEHWRVWLNKRGITDATIAEFGLSWGEHHNLGGCIVIPIRNGGPASSLLFNKYRRDPLCDEKPKYVYDKGSRVALFGGISMAAPAANKGRIFIVEGEMDALVLISHGYHAVSSTGGALSWQKEWGAELSAIASEIHVCFDNDEPGAKGMVRVLESIPHAKVLILPPMPGVKDISDYVAHGGDLHEFLQTGRTFAGEDEVREDMARRKALWLPTMFHEAYLDARREVPRPKSVARDDSSDEIARAKAFPIHELMPFDRQGNALCIWHTEHSPSLHYYKESNHVFCFGCSKRGDAIDVARQLENLTFKEAVKKLARL